MDLKKAIEILGEDEVAFVRAKASKCSEDHSPERIASCQCRVCTLKRQGIDYLTWLASTRNDWIKKELQGRMIEEQKEIQTMGQHSVEGRER